MYISYIQIVKLKKTQAKINRFLDKKYEEEDYEPI